MSSVGKHAQPVSGFSPLNFGGCSLWLDATSPSNFALSGSNITTWYDRSPFSNHASNIFAGNPVLSNNVINGRSTVFLSNAPSLGGSMTLNTTGITGFMVLRPLQLGIGRGSDQRILSCVSGTANDFDSTSRFTVAVQQQTAEIRFFRGGVSIPRTNFNASNNYIISWACDGTTNSIYINGADGDLAQNIVLSNATFDTNVYRLGSPANNTFDPFNGHIGEVIVYNDFLIPAQRQAVEGYLAWKWGIEPDLGTTFSPLTSLPSCAVWFDGADASAFTLSGSNITQWRDKAGSNVTSNIGTPVYVSNAVNGVPGVQLDVNSGFQISPMSNAANRTTVSIYGVVTTGASAQASARLFTVGRISDGVTNNDFSASYLWTLYRPSTQALELQHTGAIVSSSSALTVGRPCLVSVVFSGTTATMWANGSNAGSINTTNTLIFDRIGIGKNINNNAGSSSDSFAGTICEFLIFYAAHTEAQRLQVESYLASKWNIPVRAPLHLVPTHPYTRTRPFLRDFFPTDIPGCALWLDAGDRATLTLSSSNTVTGWADKSGNRRPLTVNSAGTYSATGFNGRPTIQFTNGQYMTTSTAAVLTNSFTVFLVHQITGTGQGNCVFATGSADSNIASFFRTDFNTYQIGQGNGNGGSTGNWYYTVQTNPLVESFTISPVSPFWNQYLNGVRSVNPNIGGRNTAPYSTVGNSNVFIPGPVASGSYIGNISEVLIFSNALSSPQRQLVENYLATKWGHRGYMQGPLAHPFRYGPPTGVTLATAPFGCSLWLDAADASTLTLSGNNVTQWRDKSGNGYHAVPYGSPTVQSLCNAAYRGIRLSGSGAFGYSNVDPMNTTQNLTAFVVGSRSEVYGRYGRLLGFTVAGSGDHATRSGGAVFVAADSNYQVAMERASGQGSLAVSITSNVLFLGSVVLGPTSATQFINGQSNASLTYVDSTFNYTMYGVGQNASGGGLEAWDGVVCEVLAFNTLMTTTQRQQIEGYLAEKWGLRTALFPQRHAYLTGAPSGFTPASISRCSLWLDGADPSTMTLSGSNVTAWRDKSGRTTLSLTGTPPTYVSNQVRFNSSGRFQGTYTPTTQTTMFLVYSTSNTTSNSRLVTMNGNEYGNIHAPVGANNDIFLYDGGSTGLYASVTPQTGLRMYTVAFNGTSTALWRNGSGVTLTGTPGAGPPTGTTLTIGAYMTGGEPWNGELSELIFFDTALTTAQRQQVEGYLAAKWGLFASLPSNHPSLSSLQISSVSPPTVPGCSLWLDAADASSFTLSGSNVTTWADKSGNGRNFTRSGTADRLTRVTVNGSPVVYFNSDGASSNAWMSGTVPFSSDVTVVKVFTPIAFSPVNNIFWSWAWNGTGDRAPGVRGWNATPDIQPYVTYVGNNNNRIALTYGAPYVSFIEFTGGGANTRYSINGSTSVSSGTIAANTITPSTLFLGGDGPPSGATIYGRFYLSELLMFSNTLTTTQRQQIESYLAAKWGLLGSFPTAHPYLSAPQTPSISLPTVPGYSLWLDADDSSTLTLTGSNVTQWRDKSGNGYHATGLGSTTRQAFNSLQGIALSGAESFSFSNATALNTTRTLTAFVVASATTPDNYGRLLAFGDVNDDSGSVSNAVAFERGASNVIAFERAGLASGSTYTPPFSFVGSVVFTPRGNVQYINGSSNASGGATGAFNYFMYSIGRKSGGGYVWRGTVCEVLAYNFELSTDQRQAVEGYLAWKWGLSATLPVGHPYLSGPQTSITPAVVGGCKLWLDATDSTTFTLSGSNVTQWRDKSGSGYIGTAVNSPVLQSNSINGLSAVQFNGSSQYITFGNVLNLGTSPVSVFAVTRFTGDGAIIGKSSSRWFFGRWALYRFASDGGLTWFVDADPAWAKADVADTTTTTQLLQGSWDRSTVSLTQNGTRRSSNAFVNTSNFSNTDRLLVGAYADGDGTGLRPGFFLNGVIGEILVFLGPMTTTQRQSVEGYLSWKWGLPTQLPGGSGNTAALYKSLTVEFDPRSVGACGAWFDAADLTAIQFSSGSNVSRWLDKSGLQNHALTIAGTPTVTTNTLNGRPVVTFTGTQNMRSPYAPTTSTTPQTIIAVTRPSALSTWMTPVVIGTTAGGTPPPRTGITTTGYSSYGWFLGATWGGYDGAYATVASTTRTDIVVCTWYGGSNGNTSVNGTQGADSTSTTPALGTKTTGGNLTIGATVNLGTDLTWTAYNGYIAEVLVFGKALTVADRQRIEGYLAWKWGLQSQLPALHPYSNASY
jgi:hypothetical protein